MLGIGTIVETSDFKSWTSSDSALPRNMLLAVFPWLDMPLRHMPYWRFSKCLLLKQDILISIVRPVLFLA